MFEDLIAQLPSLLLSLPVVLLSLSVHEAAHGYAAYKLGDHTAKNLGRLTLNPLKHIHPIGFLAMLFFHVGWANPVPINTRYFKNPRRDMAITAAAGPVSNFLLAIIFTILLRLTMYPVSSMLAEFSLEEVSEMTNFKLLSLLVMMLYIGIILNLNLMLFNLIPLPPLDGSRIAYIFLPAKIYFGIMRYEKYIMIGFILLMITGLIDIPLGGISSAIINFLFNISGMPLGEFFSVVFYFSTFLG